MSIFVRRREAAEILGVSVRTLARWHDEGVLQTVKIGALVGYDLEDLRRITQAGSVEGAAPEGVAR